MGSVAGQEPEQNESTLESPFRKTQNSPPCEPVKEDFPVVGVGASAGGLEALEKFFKAMPVESGMAFVVVQHLSPDFKSVMDELLSRQTRIRIHRVTDGVAVRPNAIYLIPPKKDMIIADGKLLLSDKEPNAGLTLPIDIFFRSLAQDLGPRAIGVVLSGTGSDGSRGVLAIHEAGGLVLAQEFPTAKFDGMPRSAVETGVVELVLPPERMPAAILSYVENPGGSEMAEFLPADPSLLKGFDAVFQLLRDSYDIDFSHYKRGTVARRVQRRLLMLHITDLDEYVERLRSDSNELNLLYKDLLIGVTRFFRDPEAFRRIEQEVLPALLVKIRPDHEFRVWVAGCATGEEAYSLAILIREEIDRMSARVNVKVFATDVHRASLDVASAGVYSEASLSEVSPTRLQRFFTKVKHGYQVAAELRKMIVFAPHNIIKDAPFTKIDLVTCRNLLIYLEPAAQQKALSLFQFALKRGGVVVLGPSESPGELKSEFDVIDERWKVYRKRRETRLPGGMQLPLATATGTQLTPRTAAMSVPLPVPHDASLLRAHEALLNEFMPPSFLINSRRELVQTFGGASEFLKLRDGRPTNDICHLVEPDLSLPLSTALQQCNKNGAPVTYNGLHIPDGKPDATFRLTVKPIHSRHETECWFLASLHELDRPHEPAAEAVENAAPLSLDQATKDQFQALDSELRYTKENLQATVEEMETSNEELQATNEELIASNEELQSTNEELHSVNEELYTVNAEYQKKITELTELTADIDNLLQSTEVGVVFLDRDLCIRKFTSKVVEVFHFLPVDIGRRMDHFASTLRYARLIDDLNQVLTDGKPVETEISSDDKTVYLMRILPYRMKDKVEGLVVTFVDVSRLKNAEGGLRMMSKVYVDAADPIIIEDLHGKITDANAEAERVFGWTRNELIGKDITFLIPEDEAGRARELRSRCLEKGGLRNVETVKHNKRGQRMPMLLTLSVLNDQEGKPVAIASSPKDISDRKRAEETAREAVRKRDQFLAMLSHELRNPLGAALNATYILDCVAPDRVAESLNEVRGVIQRQVLQVARLLDDLLDVARVTQGRIEIRRQIIDVTKLVNDAVEAVRPVLDAKGHQVQLDVANYPIYIEGDAARILQIQENLLTNAAKYTPPNGTIQLSLVKEDEEAVLRVRDNGTGIPPEMLESIFDMFVQSDNTLSRSQGGMGLGLTLVKKLVEMHGGRVTAQSPGLGQGSDFIVRLPIVNEPPVVEKSEMDQFQGSASQSPRHIVLVEDNDDSREMLATLLKLDGHQVTVAADGRVGLEMILHQRPDVAIVDVGLPQMSGLEIAREVRDVLGKDVRLVALTGYGRSEDQEAVKRSGFDVHLVKPLKPMQLRKVLNSFA